MYWIRGKDVKTNEDVIVDAGQCGMFRIDHDKQCVAFCYNNKQTLLENWRPVRNWQSELDTVRVQWKDESHSGTGRPQVKIEQKGAVMNHTLVHETVGV